MVKGLIDGPMAECSTALMLMIKNKVTASTYGLMVELTTESGQWVNNMVEAFTL